MPAAPIERDPAAVQTPAGSPPRITPDAEPSLRAAIRCLVAEAFGTFALVYVACAAVFTSELTSAVGVAFGLVVAAMIFAIGPISGAHINPAVSFGFALHGSFAWRLLPGYVLAQCVGGFFGVLALAATFPHLTAYEIGDGGTFPALGDAPGAHRAAFVAEVLHTLVLMLVILRVAFNAKGEGLKAGLAIGATVGCLALGGGAAGASMNPARSVFFDLYSGRTDATWIYLVGPLVGAALAVALNRVISPRGDLRDLRDTGNAADAAD